MSIDKDELQEDLLAARRELDETKYRLLLFENSRTARMVRYVREFIQNPVKGLKDYTSLIGALKKADPINPPVARANEQLRSIPLRINSNNTLLRYPHIKVACLGTLNQVSDVCHAFEIGDNNWVNLIERGVDFLLVDEALFQSRKAYYKKQLTDAKAKNIPIVIIRNSTKLAALNNLPENSLIINQSIVQNKEKNDYPYIDIHAHNPINMTSVPSKTVAYFGSVESENTDGLVDIMNTHLSKNAAAIIVANPEKAISSYEALTKLLEYSAKGIPVFLANKFDVKHPFETTESWSMAKKLAESLTKDLTLWEKYSIRQRRQTILQHSQLNRFEFILDALDIPKEPLPKISAIASTKRPKEINNIIKNFVSQKYENKELVLLLHGDGFKSKSVKSKLQKAKIDYKLIERDASSLFGENLNIALDASTGDYITKMDDDDYYGNEHYNDLVAATYYSKADMVGKWSNWIYMTNKNKTTTWMAEKQESYTHHLPGGTFLAERSFLRKARFGRVSQGIDSELYRRVEARGAILYSTHRYNYVRVRHGDHTYTASDEKFLSHCSAPEFNGYSSKNTMI